VACGLEDRSRHVARHSRRSRRMRTRLHATVLFHRWQLWLKVTSSLLLLYAALVLSLPLLLGKASSNGIQDGGDAIQKVLQSNSTNSSCLQQNPAGYWYIVNATDTNGNSSGITQVVVCTKNPGKGRIILVSAVSALVIVLAGFPLLFFYCKKVKLENKNEKAYLQTNVEVSRQSSPYASNVEEQV